MHMHLDPVGGVAGDMFIAGLLDAFPEHTEGVTAAAASASGAACRLLACCDEVLTGSRFVVDEPQVQDHGHTHTAWRDIHDRLGRAALSETARHHAIGIFSLLADAEARVHGIAVDNVTFHEVGAVDSIADIVAAGYLIDALGASWSVSQLPLGGGQVRTAHGVLPVPAPATALLLDGFAMIDDGIPGERVTPTGAAILRHLGCVEREGIAGRLHRTGIGFGTRRLPGISNVLRILALETETVRLGRAHRELAVIGFEVDDQSAEDLAIGIDRLRAIPGVHDVLQMPAFGKKGRLATHIQVLARPDAREAVIDACFRETTTIGLRTHAVEGRALERDFVDVAVNGSSIRVKRVRRPGGDTSKAEADALKLHAGHAERSRLRRAAEAGTDGGT